METEKTPPVYLKKKKKKKSAYHQKCPQNALASVAVPTASVETREGACQTKVILQPAAPPALLPALPPAGPARGAPRGSGQRAAPGGPACGERPRGGQRPLFLPVAKRYEGGTVRSRVLRLLRGSDLS